MTQSQPGLNRRTIILGTALAPFFNASWVIAGVVPSTLGDFGSIFRKTRYRSDDGVLFWWMKGAKYGQIGNEAKPFHSIEACAIIRVTTTPTGWSADTLEHIFYTDLDSGRPLESMTNPFTGKTINYKRTPAKPYTLNYKSDGFLDLPSEMGGTKFEVNQNKHVLTVQGDEVWIADDGTTQILPDGGAAIHSAD